MSNKLRWGVGSISTSIPYSYPILYSFTSLFLVLISTSTVQSSLCTYAVASMILELCLSFSQATLSVVRHGPWITNYVCPLKLEFKRNPIFIFIFALHSLYTLSTPFLHPISSLLTPSLTFWYCLRFTAAVTPAKLSYSWACPWFMERQDMSIWRIWGVFLACRWRFNPNFSHVFWVLCEFTGIFAQTCLKFWNLVSHPFV